MKKLILIIIISIFLLYLPFYQIKVDRVDFGRCCGQTNNLLANCIYSIREDGAYLEISEGAYFKMCNGYYGYQDSIRFEPEWIKQDDEIFECAKENRSISLYFFFLSSLDESLDSSDGCGSYDKVYLNGKEYEWHKEGHGLIYTLDGLINRKILDARYHCFTKNPKVNYGWRGKSNQ
jgi:hypothetical protein